MKKEDKKGQIRLIGFIIILLIISISVVALESVGEFGGNEQLILNNEQVSEQVNYSLSNSEEFYISDFTTTAYSDNGSLVQYPDDCGTLNTTNAVYYLYQNIINNDLSGDCIIISAQNITLDCNGYYIQGEDNFTGVYSNRYNTTVKNCNINNKFKYINFNLI